MSRLEGVVARGLAKGPADPYQTCGQFAAALRAAARQGDGEAVFTVRSGLRVIAKQSNPASGRVGIKWSTGAHVRLCQGRLASCIRLPPVVRRLAQMPDLSTVEHGAPLVTAPLSTCPTHCVQLGA